MPTVAYRFTSIGADEVARHFDTISARAQAHQTTMRGLGRQRAQDSTAGTRVADAEARQKQRNLDYVARIRDRHFRDEQRKFEQHQKALARQNDKESRDYLQKEEAKLKQSERQRDQYMRRQQAQQQRQQRSLEKFKSERLGEIGDRVATASMGGLGIVSALTAKAAQDRMALSDAANRLSINARMPGQSAVDPRVLAKEAETIALTTPGTKAEDVISAQSKFVAMTGDLGTARALGSTMAVAANASGSNMTDIAATMATMRTKFGITDPEQAKQAMAALIVQGKSGAFEMSDASQYFEEMGAAGARFGLDKGTKGIETLGGLAQIAKGSTGSGAEAATAVRSLFADLIGNSQKVKQFAHTDVFKKGSHHTETNDIQDVLVNTIAGAKGDQVKLDKIFGERSIKAVSGLVTAYNEAQNALGKGASETDRRAAGEKAMRDLLEQSISVQGSWNDIVQDSAQASQSFSSLANAAWEETAHELGNAVMPTIRELATHGDLLKTVLGGLGETIGDTMDSFESLISWMEKNIPGFKRANGNEEGNAATAQATVDRLTAIEMGGGKLTSKQERERMRAEDTLAELAQKGVAPHYEDTRPGAGGVLLPLRPGEKPPLQGPYSDAYYAANMPKVIGADMAPAKPKDSPFSGGVGMGVLKPEITVPSLLGAPVGVGAALLHKAPKLDAGEFASAVSVFGGSVTSLVGAVSNLNRGDPTGGTKPGQ